MPKVRRAARRKAEVREADAPVVSLVRALVASDLPRADEPVQAGMRVGRLAHISANGDLWVELRRDGCLHLSLRSIATVVLERSDVGAEVVVWESVDDLGIVLGKRALPEGENAPSVEARVDGKRVVLEAADEIVLRCGKASLVLRRNGRVQLKGAYVETQAEGVNRIKGGSVQIN